MSSNLHTSPPKRSWLWPLFGLVMIGTMGLGSAFLFQECKAGDDTVKAFVRAVRDGEDVSEAIGGDEAPRMTELLRASTSVHVDNFQAQAGTACFWTSVTHPGGETDVQFLLRETEHGSRVIAVSTRECECPDPDFEAECHLQ